MQFRAISKFGLLELSRQRLRPALGEGSHITCPRCNGTGHIRDTESSALQILRMVQEESMKENTAAVHVQVPVEVTSFLLNEKRTEITKIELKQRVTVLLVPNKNLETPNYRLERLRHDDPRLENLRASYTMIDDVEEEVGITRREKAKAKQEPVIKGHPARRAGAAARPKPSRRRLRRRSSARAGGGTPAAAGGGFFGWVKRLFGGGETPPAAAPARYQPNRRPAKRLEGRGESAADAVAVNGRRGEHGERKRRPWKQRGEGRGNREGRGAHEETATAVKPPQRGTRSRRAPAGSERRAPRGGEPPWWPAMNAANAASATSAARRAEQRRGHGRADASRPRRHHPDRRRAGRGQRGQGRTRRPPSSSRPRWPRDRDEARTAEGTNELNVG